MQRGRGRGQGRNPNSARSTSRRASRSSSRRAIARTRSSNSSSNNNTTTTTTTVRRSARLAQLLNGDSGSALDDLSMADVARRRQLGSSSRSRRHGSSNLRSNQSRSSRHPSSSSVENIEYAMDVVLQPPATAVAGQELGKVVVRLRTTDGSADDALADSTNLVAVATLTPVSGPTDPAVLNTMLSGRRFNSIFLFSDEEADCLPSSIDMDDARGIGYTEFPDLAIRQPGTWRICITLMRIRNMSSDPPASLSGGTSVHEIHSNPIVVQGSGPLGYAHYNGKPW